LHDGDVRLLGDPDLACASAVSALNEAQLHGLGIIPDEIRRIRKIFPPQWRTLPPVVELDDRLHATPSEKRPSP
jgi:hypothetical protein